MIGEHEIQKRTRRDHGQLRHVFGEPPQVGEHLGGRLDFVQEEDRGSRDDPSAKPRLKPLDGGCRTTLGKQRRIARITLKVDLDQIPVRMRCQFPHQPGLSTLSCSAHDEGFPVNHPQPVNQICQSVAFHVTLDVPRS